MRLPVASDWKWPVGTGLLAGDEGLSAMTNMMNYDPLAMCETNRKVSLKSKVRSRQRRKRRGKVISCLSAPGKASAQAKWEVKGSGVMPKSRRNYIYKWIRRQERYVKWLAQSLCYPRMHYRSTFLLLRLSQNYDSALNSLFSSLNRSQSEIA